jgi:hypothetical protein
MASFSNCSFNKKGEHSSSHAFSSKDKQAAEKSGRKHRSASKERELKQASVAKQKSKAAAAQCQDEQNADLDKRSQQFENEFAKNKAKEFKDAHSRSKSEQNKFQRSDQAKKLRRNHTDNQRNRKNQEYCLIEEKKFIKKRFLKDDSCEAMEDMDKDFAADYETAKNERSRSESCERQADEKESSYVENAKQCKSQAAKKNSYHASERHADESENSDVCLRKQEMECDESESEQQAQCCSRCGKQSCKGGKHCSSSSSKTCKKCGHKKCQCGKTPSGQC